MICPKLGYDESAWCNLEDGILNVLGLMEKKEPDRYENIFDNFMEHYYLNCPLNQNVAPKSTTIYKKIVV